MSKFELNKLGQTKFDCHGIHSTSHVCAIMSFDGLPLRP